MVSKTEKAVLIDLDLHKRLKIAAAVKDVSIKSYVTDALDTTIRQDKQ